MGDSEKLCLRWNDFESNISLSLCDLRDDPDFLDVTLVSEDDRHIQAHKIILSACSPFFKRVLKKHRHANPLLYLKGVRYADLVAVLNFMYQGEVNVPQDDLNSFLAVAEELRVKGLTTNTSSSPGLSSSSKARHQQSHLYPAASRLAASGPASSRQMGRPRPTSTQSPTAAKRPRPGRASTDLPDSAEDVSPGQQDHQHVSVKTEPRVAGTSQQEDLSEQTEAEFHEGNQEGFHFEGAGEPTEGFEESGDHHGDFIDDQGEMDMMAGAAEAGSGKAVDPQDLNQPSFSRNMKRPYDVLEHGTVHRTRLYISDGYGYIKDSERKGKLYLRCRAGHSTKCKGRANIDLATEEFFVTVPHTCDVESHILK